MQNEIGRLRREFQEGRAKLFPPEARVAPCLELLQRHVDLIDHLVEEIYVASCRFADRDAKRTQHSALSIVATGGYGHRELSPFSDIDIAFVPSEEEDAWVEAVVHMAFKLVMDVFLSFREVRVGYSYRPISEVCTWDLSTRTALLDARHLCGDPRLSERLRTAVRAALSPLDLVLEQQAEERGRGHEMPLYSVEPHLKQGIGSLRDLHCGRWIFKLLLSVEDAELLPVLCQRGYLSARRVEEIRAATEWFWSARNWMHILAGKRSDVLIVDYQDRIAQELVGCSAQEWLSRHFAHAEVLALFREASVRRVLNGPLDLDGVRLQNGHLHGSSASAAKLMLLSQRYSIPISIDDVADLAERRSEAALVEEPSAEEALAFTAILNEKRNVAGTLGFMARMGLLDRFVPDFSKLMRLVPPDAAHSYTVGGHSLRVIEQLERLRAGNAPSEQRFSELISQCSHFDMLCLAALLHDTGKAFSTGDHSESAIAPTNAAAGRLNLPAEKRQILEILVRHHLLLVRTARLQDLKSQAVIQAVAEKCSSVEILRHLYVFTYADTRGVAEKSWTSLDYRDLEELYAKVQDVLSGKSQESPESIAVEDRIGQIRRKLAAPNGPHGEQAVLRHCDAMPAGYVLNTPLDEIAFHLQLLERLTTDKVVLDIYNRPGDDYSELTVCAYDDPQPGLLAKITGVLFGCNAGIQKAQVYTLSGERPVVLDMLWIRAMGMQVSENRAARIRTALVAVLGGAQTVEQFLRNMGKQAPSGILLNSLDLRNDLSEEHTVVHVVAPDAQGLLYCMTRALSRCGLHIHTAKVATWNTHAENNFYVTALTGGRIPDNDLALWKHNLARQLGGGRVLNRTAMLDRLRAATECTFAPDVAFRALQLVAQCSPVASAEIESGSEFFLRHLAELLVVSPAMSDAIRSHPNWLSWLRGRIERSCPGAEGIREGNDYGKIWEDWISETVPADFFVGLAAFKRREYLEIICLDVAGLISFQEITRRLAVLADVVIGRALEQCWKTHISNAPGRFQLPPEKSGFAVLAFGKLGGRELNYSSDVDLVFCRRPSEDDEEGRFYTRLAERLIHELSRFGPEGSLYRVDMRLRPYGETGNLVPTLGSLMNYYESWGEAWEKQALIKARFVAGDESLGRRFGDFAARSTFARQMEDLGLEEIKRVKHRSEREYAQQGDRFHLKQGAGGIRDIEFYVQYLQLIAGTRVPAARAAATLDALEGLAQAKILLEGELSRLSLAYLFLRTVEHRLQLRSLTPQVNLPTAAEDLQLLACGLGFTDSAGSASEQFLRVLGEYRRSVRSILERIYFAPGFLRPSEREEEFAQLLSERTPKERIRQLLSQFGFQEIDKAWQNVRLIGLGPAGRLLPPGERRAFVALVYPLLEVVRDSIDPDQALHNLESFLTATGNRLSFLRALASRRPHLVRLTNLLALSNLAHQILSRHPEYFDALARGVHLDEGRNWDGLLQEIEERVGSSPSGEGRDTVLRRFRQRETIRIAYRDLAGLADPLEISAELADLAEACVRAAARWTRLSSGRVPDDYQERLCTIALGKFGSRHMHYSSDLDLVFLYDAPEDGSPEERAEAQQAQDSRIESILSLLGGVTAAGVVYRVDLRLRPEGGSGLLARSWAGFFDHARQFMQPWERMALVRSRMIGRARVDQERWSAALDEIVYGFRWDEDAIASIRHLKRRIESEKNKESRSRIDFKYGRGSIVDLEFLVQFLQIRYGPGCVAARAPSPADAIPALWRAGAISAGERDSILAAHRFTRKVENHYQMMEEWPSREISRDSPMLIRLARSLGYSGESGADARRRFLSDWDDTAQTIRALVDKHFYG